MSAMRFLLVLASICVGLPFSQQFRLLRVADLTQCKIHGFACYRQSCGAGVPSKVYACQRGETCCEVPPCVTTCVHGSCEPDLAGVVSCVCQDGYSGANCDVDACANNGPCVNGACVRDDSPARFTCDCPDGFNGNLCETDACENNGPCVTGTCNRESSPTLYTCDCPDGFGGNHCETDHCESNGQCVGGTCIRESGPTYFSCDCQNGYSGDLCDTDACEDNGQCVTGTCIRESSPTLFTCGCPDGYHGDLCQTDACDGNGPCVSGTCVRLADDPWYRCDCQPGYIEQHCDVLNWTCSYTETDEKKGLTGREDAVPAIDIEECKTLCTADTKCLAAEYRDNRDECYFYYDTVPNTKNDQAYVFLEKSCSEVCDQPCVNGVCQTVGGVKQCVCDAGYSGPTCEVDACATVNVCNSGTCERTTTAPLYSCTCGIGVTGANCETVVCSFTDSSKTKGDTNVGKGPKLDAADLEECKSLCLADPSCVAGDYKDSKDDCYLYSIMPPTKGNNDIAFFTMTCD